jgi:hypothetical protein
MESLVKVLEEGNLEVVARAVFRSKLNRPCDKWSLSNRILMLINETDDARGYRQWNAVNRYVKKGSKAIYILGPMTKKFKDEKTGEEVVKVYGFHTIPVFRLEDTEGEPLEEDDFQLEIPVCFDRIIKELNIDVAPTAFDGSCYGWYCSSGLLGQDRKIRLATPEIKTFLHELCHAVDDVVIGKLKPGQRKDQELIAEFGAAVLARLLGYDIPLGNAKRYIESYGTVREVVQFFGRLEKIISYIYERVVEDKSLGSIGSQVEALAVEA